MFVGHGELPEVHGAVAGSLVGVGLAALGAGAVLSNARTADFRFRAENTVGAVLGTAGAVAIGAGFLLAPRDPRPAAE